MQAITNNWLKITRRSLMVAVLLFLAFSLWLYLGQRTGAKTAVFKALPFPAAFVDGRPVLMKDFIFKYNLAKTVLNTGQQKLSEAEINRQIFEQLIKQAKIARLAQSLNVRVSQKQLDLEYQKQSDSENAQDAKTFSGSLANYGLSEQTFKTQVLRPSLLLNNLQIWFNSQSSLNPQSYQLAGDLLKQINDGADFSALATEFTEDNTGKSLGGNLGFVDPADLAPELVEPVSNLRVLETKIIPGQSGLHIIQLEEKNGNRLHLRQIFLNTDNFDSWFLSKTQNYKIIKLIKL